jgi:hypothetical protein
MEEAQSIPFGHSPAVHQFIREEVQRQGHNLDDYGDGGRRVNWMHTAWDYAMDNSSRQPTLNDVIRMGHMIEPENNYPHRFRAVNVSVGNRIPPHHEDVPHEMARLWNTLPDVRPCDENCGGDNTKTTYYETSGYGHSHPTVDDFYVKFEQIHPFADGNGRTGKVIHNWLNHSLDNPTLVPDYFGGGVP